MSKHETCDICIEPFNRSTRKCIECFNCQNKACSTCVRRFILESSSDAKCLHCNIQWDRRFMVQNLTQKFCNQDYRQHRANLLFEQKKSFLPRISNILSFEHDLKELRVQEQQIVKQYREKMREIRKMENDVAQLKDAFFSNRDETLTEGNITTERNLQNRPCITENCLGFLDGKGFCPICSRTTCLSCNIDKTESDNHECKEEDKAQWVAIRNSTKPCPSCRVRIFKISGCDQMWCVHCNTAFSWSRGTIERGAIHNPHYFDWLFEGGAEPRQQDNVDYCNDRELPPERNLSSRMFNEYKKIDETRTFDDFRKYPKKRYIFDIYRILRHLQYVMVPQLQQNEYAYRRGLYGYLVSMLENKDCKKLIEQYDYKHMCNLEMAEIIGGFIREVIYVFNSYMRDEEMSMIHILTDIKQYTSMYLKGIERFEKEYKRSFSKFSNCLRDMDKKTYLAIR